MTQDDIRRIRKGMGMSQRQLAQALRLGPNGDRTIRRWERGVIPITGPASLALEYMEKENGSKKQTAARG